jgi:hypothetical protein
MEEVVRFWLMTKLTEDQVETAFLSARLELVMRAARRAGLVQQAHFGEEEAVYWFEGSLEKVAAVVKLLGQEYDLTGLGVEVSDKEEVTKWPKEVKVGSLALASEEVPGHGERRMRAQRRHLGWVAPSPELELEIKREFIPEERAVEPASGETLVRSIDETL